jgi:hypothetical protein
MSISCLSLDAQILMCEECRLVLDPEKEPDEYWTLANGMNMVPCADHLNQLEKDEHDVA